MDSSCSEDLTNSLNFLAKFRWVYNFQITKFFETKAWMHVPSSWVEHLISASLDDLNNLPFGVAKEEWPDSLKQFTCMCHKLSGSTLSQSDGIEVAHGLRRGMNQKKLHEVTKLAAFLQSTCLQNKCQHIIDIGSGLGYLGLVLSEQLSYHVLGLESEASRSHGALSRAEAASVCKPENFESMLFVLSDTEETYSSLNKLLDSKTSRNSSNSKSDLLQEVSSSNADRNKLRNNTGSSECQIQGCSENRDANCFLSTNGAECPKTDLQHCCLQVPIFNNSVSACDTGQSDTGENWCMTGLHCCGDLSPIMMKAFMKIPCVRSLVCVSCCYHRMTTDSSEEFLHFPASKTVKESYKSMQREHPGWKIDMFALRLAAQETRARWKTQTKDDHDYHKCNVAYRGIVELAMKEYDDSGFSGLRKTKRKLARKEHFRDFDTYIRAVIERTETRGSIRAEEDFISYAQQKYAENEEFIKFIEPFTSLQVAMQGVLESLILRDRILFLQENGFHSELVQIFDDYISPRSVAIHAWK